MAIFSIKESTAAQRYMERKIKEDIDDFSYKNVDHLVKKGSNENIKFAQKYAKEVINDPEKITNKKNSKLTDNQKATEAYAGKAMFKKLLGITNSEAKKRGMKLEDLKEACESILNILDESEYDKDYEPMTKNQMVAQKLKLKRKELADRASEKNIHNPVSKPMSTKEAIKQDRYDKIKRNEHSGIWS